MSVEHPVLTFLLSSHDWAAQVVFTGLSLVNSDPVGPIRGQGHCWRNVAPEFFFLSCKGQMKLSVSSEYLECTDKFALKYVGYTYIMISVLTKLLAEKLWYQSWTKIKISHIYKCWKSFAINGWLFKYFYWTQSWGWDCNKFWRRSQRYYKHCVGYRMYNTPKFIDFPSKS